MRTKRLLPKEMNYAEAYLTLKCNLGCSYCINDNDGVDRNRKELSSDQWARFLNGIDFSKIPITLGGGEPTSYSEFYDLLKKIEPQQRVDLLTNLTFDIDEFLENVNSERFQDKTNPAYKPIRASFHPERMDPDVTINKLSKLQENGFDVGLFGINHPKHVLDNMQMAELARRNNIYFFVKDFLGNENGHQFGYLKYPKAISGERKDVLCRSKELLMSPDGEVYKCHRDLYHKENALGNITSGYVPDYKFRKCSNYGTCNPCDVKLKTNRFLQDGQCQVDILPRAQNQDKPKRVLWYKTNQTK